MAWFRNMFLISVCQSLCVFGVFHAIYAKEVHSGHFPAEPHRFLRFNAGQLSDPGGRLVEWRWSGNFTICKPLVPFDIFWPIPDFFCVISTGMMMKQPSARLLGHQGLAQGWRSAMGTWAIVALAASATARWIRTDEIQCPGPGSHLKKIKTNIGGPKGS